MVLAYSSIQVGPLSLSRSPSYGFFDDVIILDPSKECTTFVAIANCRMMISCDGALVQFCLEITL